MVPARSVPTIPFAPPKIVIFVPAEPRVATAEVLPLSDVTTGLSITGAIENTGSPVPVSLVRELLRLPEEIEDAKFPYNVPEAGSVTVAPVAEFKVIGPPEVTKFPASVIVRPVLATPVPPLAPANIPVTPVDSGKPVAFVRTAALGVPKAGAVSIGFVNVLLVNVSDPPIVDKVPVVGKVTEVVPVDVNVVANAPSVVKLPPKVIVFPIFATPVPPNCPATVPPKAAEPSKSAP
jgi:hypothetical protein